MSMNTNPDILVKNYVKQVKNKLPEWLKGNKKELQDTLDEIENHVWDKSYEIAGSDNPTAQHVEQAINSLGNPAEIAKDYKKRGTPAIFITKELMPLYVKASLLIFGILLVLQLLAFVFQIGSISGLDIVTTFFGGLFQTALSVLFFTSLIFVILSREGYLPENLGVKPKKNKAQSEQKSKDTIKKPVQVKKGGLLIGGLFLVFFGILFIFQPPFPQFNNEYITVMTLIFNDGFRLWLRLVGALTVYEGVLNLYRATLYEQNLKGHLIVMSIIAATITIPSLLLLFWLEGSPNMYPALAEIYMEVPELGALENLNFFNVANPIQICIRIVIVLVIYDFCEKVYKIYKLANYRNILKNL